MGKRMEPASTMAHYVSQVEQLTQISLVTLTECILSVYCYTEVDRCLYKLNRN